MGEKLSTTTLYRDREFSLLRQEYPPILTSGEMLSHPGGWDKPILEVIHLWRHRTSTPNNLEKSLLVCVLDIVCKFLGKNEKNNQSPHWGTRESHPHVQDLQHPRLGKPRLGLQILHTWMGFPRPSLNGVLDSINPSSCQRYATSTTWQASSWTVNLWHSGGFPCPCTKSW